jgi:Xaa-Pro aminopeptidase
MTEDGVDRTGGLPAMQVAERLERARRRLAECSVDALLVTTLPNVRYLTGFSGSAGVVVLTEHGILLTTDGRYRTQSGQQIEAAGAQGVVDIEIGGAEAQRQAVRSLLVSSGARRIGLEADNVSWAAARRWAELLEARLPESGQGAEEGARGMDLVPTSRCIEALREVKDEAEIFRMARAAAIADAALDDIRELLRAATDRRVTEVEVALELDTAMRRRGAEDRAFDTIVASGPNSAKPHHQPTGRPLGAGDPVVIDFGATFDGYRSDMTRTFCIGSEPSGELARVFAVVGQSQAAGVAAVRAGVGAKDVDDACREVIASAGWAEAFEHGTGHGVGLDIHEAPTVSPLGTAILEPGVVVTVEPGVYLPEIGGVRIEDTLVVTDDGSQTLTTFSKDVVA